MNLPSFRPTVNASNPIFGVLVALLWTVPSAAEPRIVFPDDECVIDVQRDFGAKGDGKTDDTEALQKALDAGSGGDVKRHRIVFLPDGVYRVRKTLVVNRGRDGSGLGPWLYGESRDGVVIRLDDGVEGVTSVLRTHPNDEGKTSANWFMRTVRNLTIDAGDNPETDGIRWFASNSGLLKDVRIIGNGPRGVHSSFLGENGPNMLQDVTIEGFETGVFSHWFYGQTLSRITVRNCGKVGVDIVANAVGIEDLVVEGTPLPLAVRIPDKAHWWSGVVALVGGRLEGTGETAVLAEGKVYLRDLETKGFELAVKTGENTPNVRGPNVREFSTTPIQTAYDEPAPSSPRLPIEREPREWETDPEKWVCANDFGITHGDRTDDSAGFQKAIDEAARRGATTVYFRGISGGDPNWYNVNREVRVHGSVRHVIGLGFGRILGGEDGRFVVDDGSAPVVAFRHIDSLGGTPVTVENRSKDRTLFIESCSVHIVGNGTGKIFATNVPGHVELRKPGQSCWVRSLDAEGKNPDGVVVNNGGKLWIMGSKSEGKGLRFVTRSGGITELYGGYEYTTEAVENDDRSPMFLSENATLFAAGVFEVSFTGKPYVVKLRDVRGERIEELDRSRIWKEKRNWTFFGTRPKPTSPRTSP